MVLHPDKNKYYENNAYAAMGAYGQSIAVFPETDVVISYKTNNIYQRSNSVKVRYRILEMIIQSYDLKT